jgi:formylglycine-generating enzyme required for sulfatase activity
VTLTRPFYLAEVPITQEVYAVVLGGAAPAAKDAQLPVKDPKFADLTKFCTALSQKTGRKVRLPTDAEWEYAARVGTSNPGFAEKYKDQNSAGPNGFKTVLPVKSKKPNAWGLYDMASGWWEITADRGMYNLRHSVVDPQYPPASDSGKIQRSGRGILKQEWSIGTHEFLGETGYAGQKFRILVEAEAAATRPAR